MLRTTYNCLYSNIVPSVSWQMSENRKCKWQLVKQFYLLIKKRWDMVLWHVRITWISAIQGECSWLYDKSIWRNRPTDPPPRPPSHIKQVTCTACYYVSLACCTTTKTMYPHFYFMTVCYVGCFVVPNWYVLKNQSVIQAARGKKP